MAQQTGSIATAAGLATVAVAAACIPALASGAALSQRTSIAREEARRFLSAGIDPSVLRTTSGFVRVRILLRRNPLASAALAPDKRAALGSRIGAPIQASLRYSAPDYRRLAWHLTTKRSVALAALSRPALATYRSQRGLVAELRTFGGRVVGRSPLTNSITALVPTRALSRLVRRPEVQAIESAPEPTAQGLVDSSNAIGADSFWTAGYVGGSGSSDTAPIDLAIEYDKIQEDHPVLCRDRLSAAAGRWDWYP